MMNNRVRSQRKSKIERQKVRTEIKKRFEKRKRIKAIQQARSRKKIFLFHVFSSLYMYTNLCIFVFVRSTLEKKKKEYTHIHTYIQRERERERPIICGGGETKRMVEQEGRDQCRLPGQPQHLIFIHPGPYFSVLLRSRERTRTKSLLGYLERFLEEVTSRCKLKSKRRKSREEHQPHPIGLSNLNLM